MPLGACTVRAFLYHIGGNYLMARVKVRQGELFGNVSICVKRNVAEALLAYVRERTEPGVMENIGHFARKQFEILRMIPGVRVGRDGMPVRHRIRPYDCAQQLLQGAGGLYGIMFASEEKLAALNRIGVSYEAARNVHEAFNYALENCHVFRTLETGILRELLGLPSPRKELAAAAR